MQLPSFRKKGIKTKEIISIDDTKVIMKRYRLRRTGAQGSTIEISVPREIVEREARRLGVTWEEMVEKLIGVWKYGEFQGVYLCFEVGEK